MALKIDYTLRLPDGEFFPAARKKSGIAIPYPPIDYYGERLFDFKGILGHALVRRDKSDPAPDVTLWDRLIEDSKLTVVPIPKAPQPEAIHLSDQALDRVFDGNMLQRRLCDFAKP